MPEFNVCKNWSLYCFEVKERDKSLVLKCSMNRKKKDGTYSKSIFVDVVAIAGKTVINENDYQKARISVDGNFSVEDYVKGEETITKLVIYASEVRKVD